MTDLPPLPPPDLGSVRIGRVDQDMGHSDEAMRAYGAACAAAEREEIILLITEYQIPVGNSRAGEMAADWTLEALREIRASIRARKYPADLKFESSNNPQNSPLDPY